MVELSTCSRRFGRIDRLMMATSRVRDIGAICGAEAPISTAMARTTRSAAALETTRMKAPSRGGEEEAGGGAGDDKEEGAERGGVDGAAGDDPPTLAEPVGGRPEERT